jgi:predicted O-linked N-acetylglucosamine transferase (SPINDLY family)
MIGSIRRTSYSAAIPSSAVITHSPVMPANVRSHGMRRSSGGGKCVKNCFLIYLMIPSYLEILISFTRFVLPLLRHMPCNKLIRHVKIEPTTFRSWLRILARVPKAILWLLRFPELGEANLRATAKLWAGTEVASRLVFTDVAPKNQHISRARVCDLFLDTPECNAHTTAADVLWSSTPLLTLPRYPYKMCSRMAASILKGALPKTEAGRQVASELIAESDAEYEQAAIRLAGGLRYNITSSGIGEGIGRLAEMRKILWQSKWQCGLFDTRRWVDEVERAYEEAWRRWVSGEGGDIYL